MWYLEPWARAFDFRGRSRRAPYVAFTVVHFFVSGLFWIPATAFRDTAFGDTAAMCYYLFWVLVFVPSLAVTVRRLHDLGQSGWLALLGFVPVLNFGGFLLLSLVAGLPYPNKYGPPAFAPSARFGAGMGYMGSRRGWDPGYRAARRPGRLEKIYWLWKQLS